MVNIDSRETDLNILAKLESMYSALSLAVQDPVVIPNPEFAPEEHKRLPVDISNVYFYVEEKAGEEIVRERIKVAGDDIRESLMRHQEMCNAFQEIDESLARKEREITGNTITDLCDRIGSYGGFVLGHQHRFGEKAFLQFPHYGGDNISYRRRNVPDAAVRSRSEDIIQVDFNEKTVDQSIRLLTPFNIKANYDGLKLETRELRRLTVLFRLSKGPLWAGVYTGHPDASYTKNIGLTKMLLREHLGFEVE